MSRFPNLTKFSWRVKLPKQNRLVVRYLVHDDLVFLDLVADRIGVVDEVLVGQTVRNKEFVELGNDLRQPLFLLERSLPLPMSVPVGVQKD